jgi:hypothetical protein
MKVKSKSQSFSIRGTLIVAIVSTVFSACDGPAPKSSPPLTPPASTPIPVADNDLRDSVPEPVPPAQHGAARITKIPAVADEPPANPAELAQRFRTAADAEDRGAIVDELWQLDSTAAIETIRQLYLNERDESVKVDMVAGLTDSKRPETRQSRFGLIAVALAPGQPKEVREIAVQMLVDFDDPRAVQLLRQYENDPDAEVRDGAREALEARKEIEEP